MTDKEKPTPDRDNAIKEITWYLTANPLYSDPDTYIRFREGLKDALKLLENQKTGKWEKNLLYSEHGPIKDEGWHCSICLHSPLSKTAWQYRYCPFCGAKMERGLSE